MRIIIKRLMWTKMIKRFLIDIDELVYVNANVFVTVTITFGFIMSGSLGEFRCWPEFDCRPMTALDCVSVLQAWIPSYHVWSRLVLPALPQFLNQEPLWPQQLIFPDFVMIPHLGHTELMIIVVTAVFMWVLVKTQRWKHENCHCLVYGSIYLALALDLRLQAPTPSNHLWYAFLLPVPPQFLYQVPPGAQQLALPDFSNVPHFGHVILLLEVMASVLMLTGVVIDAPTISSRSGIGRRDIYWRMVVKVHTRDDIDPKLPVNMAFLLAFERTQAAPHSLCLNNVDCQCQNM